MALFLTRDALAPAELTAVLPDRAARRLCDRLVELGALLELTGRYAFTFTGSEGGARRRRLADAAGQSLDLGEFDLAVLAAIAFHQPITRDRLYQIFGREISYDLIGRLSEQELITTGPRAPQRRCASLAGLAASITPAGSAPRAHAARRLARPPC